MIKKNLRLLIITSVVILLPILAGVLLWDRLPEQIPFHWNTAGEVDDWTTKPFAVFGMPLILLGGQWLAMLMTLADPKKQNHSEKILQLIFWIIPVMTLVLSALTYSAALGTDLRVEEIVWMLVGLLFVAIGNYLPKCKQNYTIGIKIPWTLSSEENWNRTHRLAGWVWVVCGVVVMIAAFLGFLWLIIGAALVMSLVPCIYSYVLHCKGI
jgi:uncharacterized membrane protein